MKNIKSLMVLAALAFTTSAIAQLNQTQTTSTTASPLVIAPKTTSAPEEAPLAQVPAPVSLPPLPRVSGTEELDRLREKNAILTEQVKNFELMNKMGMVPSIEGLSASPIALSRPSAGGMTSAGSSRSTSNYGTQVKMVAGQKGNLTATVQTADGGAMRVRTGDTIPGVGKVKSIDANQVLVENKKSVVALPFAAEFSAPDPSGMGMPGIPGMGR